MNSSNYGYPSSPNKPIRIAPPEWRNYKMILATTSAEVVPQNVYQMLVMVFGGGGNSGGGFRFHYLLSVCGFLHFVMDLFHCVA